MLGLLETRRLNQLCVGTKNIKVEHFLNFQLQDNYKILILIHFVKIRNL